MSATVNQLPVNEEENLPNVTTEKLGATGAYVGFNEAVRLSGVSKPTFSKYIEKGKLSPILNEKGRKVYQVVDIQRVFPEGGKATGEEKNKVNPSLPVNRGGDTTTELIKLQGEKAVLEAQLAAERDKSKLLAEIAAKAEHNADNWRIQAERAALMFTPKAETAKPETTPQSFIDAESQPLTPEPKKGFLSRIFGGGK